MTSDQIFVAAMIAANAAGVVFNAALTKRLRAARLEAQAYRDRALSLAKQASIIRDRAMRERASGTCQRCACRKRKEGKADA